MSLLNVSTSIPSAPDSLASLGPSRNGSKNRRMSSSTNTAGYNFFRAGDKVRTVRITDVARYAADSKDCSAKPNLIRSAPATATPSAAWQAEARTLCASPMFVETRTFLWPSLLSLVLTEWMFSGYGVPNADAGYSTSAIPARPFAASIASRQPRMETRRRCINFISFCHAPLYGVSHGI